MVAVVHKPVGLAQKQGKLYPGNVFHQGLNPNSNEKTSQTRSKQVGEQCLYRGVVPYRAGGLLSEVLANEELNVSPEIGL